MKRFAACVVVALSVTSIGFAQQPVKEAPTAMLSVVVTDFHGNHVQSLTKDDFQLTIGGKPLPVARFSERGAGGQFAGEMRRIAVLFDATTISAGARRQVIESLHPFLARVLRPGDMVAIFAGGPSLRPVTGWTSDLKRSTTRCGSSQGRRRRCLWLMERQRPRNAFARWRLTFSRRGSRITRYTRSML